MVFENFFEDVCRKVFKLLEVRVKNLKGVFFIILLKLIIKIKNVGL